MTIMAVWHFGHRHDAGACVGLAPAEGALVAQPRTSRQNCKASRPPTVGEITDVADANEALRQDV